jgi:phosphatidylserine/phosphatidylglycerophosphate/cardiolipin synthase-like enzyme
MNLSKFLKFTTIGLAGAIVFGEVYHHFALTLRKKFQIDDDDDDEVFEIVCTRQPTDYNSILTRKMLLSNETIQHPMEIIKNIILSAKKSIHIAMYIFTSPTLAEALKEVHKKGVKVFVIVDHSMKMSSNDNIQRFHDAGITLKLFTASTMHHKFCLVDVPYIEKMMKLAPPPPTKFRSTGTFNIPDTGVAIAGSLNWTREGLMSNRENFFVFTNKKACERLSIEFFDIWNSINV